MISIPGQTNILTYSTYVKEAKIDSTTTAPFHTDYNKQKKLNSLNNV